MPRQVFLLTFFISALLQFVFVSTFALVDQGLWATQAMYVENSDPLQFDQGLAYVPPGGPIIIGTILFNNLGLDYSEAVVAFIVLANALLIGLICSLCYLLQQNSMWWLIVCAVLSVNRLYVFTSPPTLLVSLLLIFLALYSIYLYSRIEVKPAHLLLWGFVVGAAAATRLDIAGVISFALVLYLLPKINLKQLMLMVVSSMLFFVLVNPFMWSIPFDHINHIFQKMFHFYGGALPRTLSIFEVLSISYTLIMSTVLGYLVVQKSKTKVISRSLYFILFATTLLLYLIFLTSSYQAERYFVPIIILWQVFLPAFLFAVFPRLTWKMEEGVTILNLRNFSIMATMFVLWAVI